MWLPDTVALAKRVCSKVRRNLSREEWVHFIRAGIPYEATYPNLPNAPTLEIATEVQSLDLTHRLSSSRPKGPSRTNTVE